MDEEGRGGGCSFLSKRVPMSCNGEEKAEEEAGSFFATTRPITSGLILDLVGVLITKGADQAMVNPARYW